MWFKLFELKTVCNKVQCSHKQLTSEYGKNVGFNIVWQKYRKNIEWVVLQQIGFCYLRILSIIYFDEKNEI